VGLNVEFGLLDVDCGMGLVFRNVESRMIVVEFALRSVGSSMGYSMCVLVLFVGI